MEKIKKILFITLSNIGDVILTLPALDFLCAKFPEARITVITGPRPKEIFENNHRIEKIIVYQKHSGLRENIGLFFRLKKEKFDAVIDLRNTLFGLLLCAKYKIPLFLRIAPKTRHMADRHLYKIQNEAKTQDARKRVFFKATEKEKAYLRKILRQNNIGEEEKIIIVAPGARSHIKRWEKEKFSSVCSELFAGNKKVILVGDNSDRPIAEFIERQCRDKVLNLCGKTSLHQLAALLERSALLVTNDSAVLHLGSYLDTPIVAIFGPTDDKKYGPWSDSCAVAKKEISCRPCAKAQCKFGSLECIRSVKVEEVLRRVYSILAGRQLPIIINYRDNFKRILIVRTDRIGDVLLSTPVIKALRDSYPDAHIAMMVSPYAKEIVEGNPFLEEVIVYDKAAKHKSWLGSAKFTCKLRSKRFELAVILHPTNRVHLVAFFAGIPRRIGYDRKLGFLLTDRIKHTKQFGEKHELEYNLDLLKHLGIEPKNKNLFMPLSPACREWADELLKENGIKQQELLLAIHPGASCPSKIWPNERFAEVADKLIEKYKFRVLIVAGSRDIEKAKAVAKKMRHPAVNLAGITSVSQLAAVLKRCALFISNDSGPVHISSAVGTPVISIFGRAQKGLSPRRWGPLGGRDKVLHKNAGCIECLAHNCVREFLCLKAITVDDVLEAAELILK